VLVAESLDRFSRDQEDTAGLSVLHRRPKYLFSGLTKCGVCGGGVHVHANNYLACFSARSRGTCTNRLTIRREEVERRVLVTLQEKLLERDLFEDFCQDFTREMNRLRMEARANITAMHQELAHIDRELARFVQAIRDGVPGRDVREPMTRLGDRKEELTRLLQEAPEPKPLLHVGMADIYRQKVLSLREALQQEDARPKAVEAVRGLLDAIILQPEGEPANRLGITVQGNLAAMLTLAHNAKRPSNLDDLARSVKMVAGACNQLDWQACRVA
jgi:hypothetical protein